MKKSRWEKTCKRRKRFTLFTSNENIKIVESLKKPGLLIDNSSEIVKHEIKKREGGFLVAMMAPMTASLIASTASSLIQLVASSLVNVITGKRS